MIDQWAKEWGVSAAAVAELKVRMGLQCTLAQPPVEAEGKPGSEAYQQSLVRLEAHKHGLTLFRNNVGALLDARGVPVRYGLANESKEQNEAVKSADLIGILPVVIGPQHMGRTIGQFVSIEMKHEGWTYKGDKHEAAQLAWANFILSKGGYAAFCTGPGQFNNQR